MATFNPRTREIRCRIVYYGPGRSGKTTNLEYIYRNYQQYVLGEMVSVNTEGDRTLLFDFLPLGLGRIRDCDVRVQLLTIPGQVQYTSTRKLVLRGVDGLVFVADALQVRREKNMLSLKDLQQNLKSYGLSIFRIPLVLQYNKMDLAGGEVPVMSAGQMERELNRQLKVPSVEASAATGAGVGATLRKCLELTLGALQQDLKWAKG